MKTKICGFTQVQNALDAAMLGLDAIGLVFYEKSPRVVSAEVADEIILNLPPFVNSVGLFVNADYDEIDKILNTVAIDTLQFHGQETRAECEQYGLPYIKAIAMNAHINLAQQADDFYNASALLLDTPSDAFGGTGEVFDWNLVAKINKPIILAGGLNANNVAYAIEQTQPYAVDASSGVERSKGVKDLDKVRQFLTNCKKPYF
jgi:phosphoribosylanthranilate isomerase